MKFKLSILIIILSLLSCSSHESISNDVSYHIFRFNGKIGIVDSNGNITCKPKFDSDTFSPSEFNNSQRSKFTVIAEADKYQNHIIDIYGNEPFPNLPQLRSENYGNLATYFDDFSSNQGLHILSLKDKKEIGYYENRVAINFFGNTHYFYSILDDKSWKLFNESGEKIHEEKYRLDVDIIETLGEFEAVVLSLRGAEIRYINFKGKEFPSSKSLESKFEKLQKQKEIDQNKQYPKYAYKTIPLENYSSNVSKYEVIKAIQYESDEEIYFVSLNNKRGAINSEGRILLEMKYDKVESDYQMLFFHLGDKVGMANLRGEIIFQPKFGNIRYEPNNSRYIDVKYNEYWFEANLDGRIFTPKNIKIE
ncbi:MAG: hypothetical protein AB8F95_16315 [Bacteroidia bacterium]